MAATVTSGDEIVDHLELREIQGPTAFGGSARRFAYLTFTIAITEFRLRFYGSVLGYFWQLLRPLMLFATLYVVFQRVVKIGGTADYYPAILLMNMMLFAFFVEGASAVTSVVDREGLVRKIQVPRLAIPLAVTVTASFNLAVNLLVILLFAILSGVEPTWRWIEVPFLLAVLAAFAAGFAMLVSALYVRFRDVKPIWDVTAQILFYATPVIYILETLAISEQAKQWMALNPIATVLIQMRHALIDPSAITAAEAVGGAPMLLVPAAIVCVVLLLGYWVFNREAPRIAEEL